MGLFRSVTSSRQEREGYARLAAHARNQAARIEREIATYNRRTAGAQPDPQADRSVRRRLQAELKAARDDARTFSRNAEGMK